MHRGTVSLQLIYKQSRVQEKSSFIKGTILLMQTIQLITPGLYIAIHSLRHIRTIDSLTDLCVC